VLLAEFEFARKMINYGRAKFTPDNRFAKAFFDPASLTGSKFDEIRRVYNRMQQLATVKGSDGDRLGATMDITVLCYKKCAKGTRAKMFLNSVIGEWIILCPPFWELPSVE
jgi:hypothetical protein